MHQSINPQLVVLVSNSVGASEEEGGILESFGEDTMPSTIIEALTHNIFLYTVRKVFSYRFGTKFYLMIFSLILAIHN